MCEYYLPPPIMNLQKNAIRVEVITTNGCCSLRSKKDQFGREYNPVRFWLSGGNANQAAYPCIGKQ